MTTTPQSSPEPDTSSLKYVLMILGNRMVTEYGLDPALGANEAVEKYLHTTFPIALLTAWINANPEARLILEEMGFRWEMPAERT